MASHDIWEMAGSHGNPNYKHERRGPILKAMWEYKHERRGPILKAMWEKNLESILPCYVRRGQINFKKIWSFTQPRQVCLTLKLEMLVGYNMALHDRSDSILLSRTAQINVDCRWSCTAISVKLSGQVIWSWVDNTNIVALRGYIIC